jgi:hypothetical protein
MRWASSRIGNRVESRARLELTCRLGCSLAWLSAVAWEGTDSPPTVRNPDQLPLLEQPFRKSQRKLRQQFPALTLPMGLDGRRSVQVCPQRPGAFAALSPGTVSRRHRCNLPHWEMTDIRKQTSAPHGEAWWPAFRMASPSSLARVQMSETVLT